MSANDAPVHAAQPSRPTDQAAQPLRPAELNYSIAYEPARETVSFLDIYFWIRLFHPETWILN